MAWFRNRLSRNGRSPASYRPTLEALEERRVPSGTSQDGVFIRYNNGQLWQHTAAGFQFIDVNVANVSSGMDSSGHAAAFILYNSGILAEWSAATGSHLIDGNVVGVSASSLAPDTAFILYNTGAVYEHTGVSSASGFRYIDTNAVKLSAGLAASDAVGPAVFIVYNTGALYEWSPAGGFQFIDVNVRSVSASQLVSQPDTAFVVYNNNALYEHSHAGFHLIDNNVVGVTVGETGTSLTGFQLAAFILYDTGAVYEWSSLTNSFTYVDINAVGVSAPMAFNSVFIVYNNGALYEWSLANGFQVVDGGVVRAESQKIGA
jgi:hypothetical protein